MVAPTDPRSGCRYLTLPSAQRPEPARPLRVLLIEDSALIRELVAEAIEIDGGALVAFATDSETAAVRELRAARYDVIIVDLQLREGSGFGVLRSLQDLGTDALVIVLTNSASSAMRQRCAELGADRFVDKSREFEEIRNVMRSWASRRRLC